MYTPLPDVPVGVEESDEIDAIRIFPNPTKDEVTIQTDKFKSPVTIQLYDSHGSIVHELKTRQSKITLGLKEFGSGMYLLCVSDQKRTVRKKVIVN